MSMAIGAFAVLAIRGAVQYARHLSTADDWLGLLVSCFCGGLSVLLFRLDTLPSETGKEPK